MPIQESGEMYLETILILRGKLPQVRAIDIVAETGYSKPSISRAISLLKNDGLVLVDDSSYITLTPDGEAIAKGIYERHRVLTELFIKLGVNAKVAAEDACKIEHCISNETFEKVKEYEKKLRGI